MFKWPKMLRHADDWAEGLLGRSCQRFADVGRRDRVSCCSFALLEFDGARSATAPLAKLGEHIGSLSST